MNRTIFAITGLAVAEILACGQTGRTFNQLGAIRKALAKGEIGAVDVFWVPQDVYYRSKLTPRELEDRAFYRVAVDDVGHVIDFLKLLESLTAESVRSGDDGGDIRWESFFSLVAQGHASARYTFCPGRLGATSTRCL